MWLSYREDINLHDAFPISMFSEVGFMSAAKNYC